jgi:BASS family bile acid:Na+ symporter
MTSRPSVACLGAWRLALARNTRIMPLCGWLVATVLRLDPGLAVGIILVASCPGGMASNMISYLAQSECGAVRGADDVLDIARLFLHADVDEHARWEVCAGGCVGTLRVCALQLTIAPVVLGVLIRWKLPRTADQIGACGPTVAVLAFTLVSGGIVAASADAIASNFGTLALAAFLLHVLGFGVGYGPSRKCCAILSPSPAPSASRSACKTAAWQLRWPASTLPPCRWRPPRRCL